jgi:hypothetical protein
MYAEPSRTRAERAANSLFDPAMCQAPGPKFACETRDPTILKDERNLQLGKLLYGAGGLEIEFEDRVLAHLQLVISAKLRRSEGFFFSWRDDPALGDGRSSIWLETSIPLRFRYSTSQRHELNREWLEELSQSANQPAGLTLTIEPGADISRPKSTV